MELITSVGILVSGHLNSRTLLWSFDKTFRFHICQKFCNGKCKLEVLQSIGFWVKFNLTLPKSRLGLDSKYCAIVKMSEVH